jgi:hypothetical protein
VVWVIIASFRLSGYRDGVKGGRISENSHQRFGFGEQFRPDQNQVLRVYREHVNSRAANRSSARDVSTVNPEMFGPRVGPRVKQSDEFVGGRVYPRDVRTPKAVAMRTSQREIGAYRFAPVLFGHNMIDLKWQREGELRHETVLAAIARALPDGSHKLPIH